MRFVGSKSVSSVFSIIFAWAQGPGKLNLTSFIEPELGIGFSVFTGGLGACPSDEAVVCCILIVGT